MIKPQKDLLSFFQGSPFGDFELDISRSKKLPRDSRFSGKEGRMMPAIDGLITISGLVYNCTVVTRNISDMERSAANILDPWV